MRRVLDRHLLALIGLAVLAGGLAYVHWGRPAQGAATSIPDAPIVVPGWRETSGAPDEVLPEDPRAVGVARWTYRRGDRVIWVVVARYRSRNDPLLRPAIDRILPEQHASNLSQEVLSVPLDDPGRSRIRVTQAVVTRPDTRFVVLYWYQLGGKHITNEYRLRLALFLHTLEGNSQVLKLVRIATADRVDPGNMAPAIPQEFLQAFYPALEKSLGD